MINEWPLLGRIDYIKEKK